MSKKAGSSRSEGSWMKRSITQPDFTRPFAITFTAVQWRLASSFANLRVTVFCERARQCGMAKVMAKPSACIHLRWATVSLNAGLAQLFLILLRWKGLEEGKRKWKRHLLCQGRRPRTLSCKDMSSSSSDQSMSAELGFFTHRASDSPIQAVKPRKWSCHSTAEHAECVSLFALFWLAATGRGTASITHVRVKTQSVLNVHP